MAAAPAPEALWYEAMCILRIWLRSSIGFSTTTIIIVVQLGFAMMLRGRLRASAAFTSGTTRGTSSHMRKALELSIITAPYFVIVSANSSDVPPPADVKAMSTSLKSSLCCRSFTSYSLPLKLYFVPAERLEPNSTRSSNGKFLSAMMRRNSCPTAPLAPTIATFISICFCYLYSPNHQAFVSLLL